MQHRTSICDALIYLGRDCGMPAFQYADLASIQRTLDKYHIETALLHAFACRTLDVTQGNRLIFDAAASDPRLVPCPAVLPNSELEVGDEADFVDQLIQDGARCVCLYPNTHGTTLDARIVGPLMDALQDRRLPLAVFEAELLDVASLASAYPRLPVIVHAPLARNRTLLATLRATPNLYISIAPRFARYRALEVIVQQCGPDRLLLGSGYPISEPGAPIAYLLYSDLNDEAVGRIARDNLLGLLAQVDVRRAASPDLAADHGQQNSVDLPQTAGLACHVWRREPVQLPGIVDMHAHYGSVPAFAVWRGDVDQRLREMDRVGIEKMFLSRSGVGSPEAVWANDQVLKAMRYCPQRILGYATCYPITDDLGIGEIQRCIDAGMQGVKLHSAAGLAYTDPRYAPVWQYADERQLPVLLHTWGALAELKPLFERYRSAPILLAHAGAAEPESYVAYARKYPNLYLDLCFSGAPYGVIEYFVRELGPQRMLFGSDSPYMSIQQQLGRVLFADIAEDEKKAILVDNPKRILDRHRT